MQRQYVPLRTCRQSSLKRDQIHIFRKTYQPPPPLLKPEPKLFAWSAFTPHPWLLLMVVSQSVETVLLNMVSNATSQLRHAQQGMMKTCLPSLIRVGGHRAAWSCMESGLIRRDAVDTFDYVDLI